MLMLTSTLSGCASSDEQDSNYSWWNDDFECTDEEITKYRYPRFCMSNADLSGVDLSGAYLSDANLSYANLSNADLSNANLSGAYLSGANLSGADLTNASLSKFSPWPYTPIYGAILSGADLSYADLSYADLRNADLSDANLSYANLSNADLTSTDLSNADLTGTDMSGVKLVMYMHGVNNLQGCPDLSPTDWLCIGNKFVGPGADLSYSNLSYVDLTDTDLSGADLSNANLSHANLSYVEIDWADLSNANLRFTDLSNTDLRFTDLSNADLRFTDLSNSDLSYTNLSNFDLTYADLRGANLSYTNLNYIHMEYTNVSNANLSYANLSYADMTNVDLVGSNLTGTIINSVNRWSAHAINLQGCPAILPTSWQCISNNLVGPGAWLMYADLSNADLSNASLESAFLFRADLTGANLSNADLWYAELTGANLTGANLSGADLANVYWYNTICPNGTNSNDNGNTCLENTNITMEISYVPNGMSESDRTTALVMIELYTKDAPRHVDSFLTHIENGNYDNAIFHRIIDNFMIQGGDFEFGSGTGGYAANWYGYCNGQYANEEDCSNVNWTLPDEANNGLTHNSGAISMAKFHNTANTGGSQFFIVPSDSNPSHLNGDYTVFGYVTSGLDQIDLISEVATDSNDRPIYDVIIINVSIDNLDN